MPQYQGYHSTMAAIYVGLGQLDKARECAERRRAVWPGSMQDYWFINECWFHPQPDFLRRINDDLR